MLEEEFYTLLDEYGELFDYFSDLMLDGEPTKEKLMRLRTRVEVLRELNCVYQPYT